MAGDQSPASNKILGQLECHGPVSYRAGVAPWVNQSEGKFVVVLPLSVKTADAQCRLLVETRALFKSGPKTEVDFSQTAGQPLTVSLKEGSILYAIPEQESLRILVPSVGVVALTGSAKPASVELAALRLASAAGSSAARLGSWLASLDRDDRASIFSSVAHMGVIEVTEGPSVNLYNLKGDLVYRAEDKEYQAVPSGEVPAIVTASLPREKSGFRSWVRKKREARTAAPVQEVGNLYFVATDGNDATGDGSEERPWASINHALDAADEGSTIVVRPGTYEGSVNLHGRFNRRVTVRSEEPYQAHLRHNGPVVTCFGGQNLILEGFDIAHSGPGAARRVIHIQNRSREPMGADSVTSITLRENIIHDSYDGELLAIENGASRIFVESNMFYNQSGPYAQVDVNSATDVHILDNVFFNEFAATGRTNGNDTGSYVVIRDSNGDADSLVGSQRIQVQRNVFLNWEGSPDAYFVEIGKDGKPYHEAREILVENNLMLGNSPNVMRSSLGIKGAREVTFRHNTVAGDLPSHAFAMHVCTTGANPPNEKLAFFNNLWSDPTGTMGAVDESSPHDFSDVPPGQTRSFTTDHNAYWNSRKEEIPYDGAELINPTDDATSTVGNPLLGRQNRLVPPHWDAAKGEFAERSDTIRDAFERLVRRYGAPVKTERTVIDFADKSYSPDQDVLYRKRPEGGGPDIGCYEQSRLILWWWTAAPAAAAGYRYSRSPHRP